MKVFLILLFFFSLSLYSKECFNKEKTLGFNNKNEIPAQVLETLNQKKPWAAATEGQIQEAFCKRKNLYHKEIRRSFKSKDSIKRGINGIILEDSEILLKDLFDLTNSKRDLLFETKAMTVSLTDHKYQSCKKVLCVVQKLFGNQIGMKILYLKNHYGFNGSHLIDENARAWSEKEIDFLLEALSYFPSGLFPLSQNHKMLHHKEKSSEVANALIYFYEKYDGLSNDKKKYVIFHELSHYISNQLELASSKRWLSLTGWKALDEKAKKPYLEKSFVQQLEDLKKDRIAGNTEKNTRQYFKSQISFDVKMINDNKDKIISRYGEDNPEEDFAESMVAYRFNPHQLKKVSPKRYNFLKESVFKGQEYLSDADCVDE